MELLYFHVTKLSLLCKDRANKTTHFPYSKAQRRRLRLEKSERKVEMTVVKMRKPL